MKKLLLSALTLMGQGIYGAQQPQPTPAQQAAILGYNDIDNNTYNGAKVTAPSKNKQIRNIDGLTFDRPSIQSIISIVHGLTNNTAGLDTSDAEVESKNLAGELKNLLDTLGQEEFPTAELNRRAKELRETYINRLENAATPTHEDRYLADVLTLFFYTMRAIIKQQTPIKSSNGKLYYKLEYDNMVINPYIFLQTINAPSQEGGSETFFNVMTRENNYPGAKTLNYEHTEFKKLMTLAHKDLKKISTDLEKAYDETLDRNHNGLNKLESDLHTEYKKVIKYFENGTEHEKNKTFIKKEYNNVLELINSIKKEMADHKKKFKEHISKYINGRDIDPFGSECSNEKFTEFCKHLITKNQEANVAVTNFIALATKQNASIKSRVTQFEKEKAEILEWADSKVKRGIGAVASFVWDDSTNDIYKTYDINAIRNMNFDEYVANGNTFPIKEGYENTKPKSESNAADALDKTLDRGLEGREKLYNLQQTLAGKKNTQKRTLREEENDDDDEDKVNYTPQRKKRRAQTLASRRSYEEEDEEDEEDSELAEITRLKNQSAALKDIGGTKGLLQAQMDDTKLKLVLGLSGALGRGVDRWTSPKAAKKPSKRRPAPRRRVIEEDEDDQDEEEEERAPRRARR